MPPKKRSSQPKPLSAPLPDPPPAAPDVDPDAGPESPPSERDHVLLKIPLTDQQLDNILKSDSMIDVLKYTPTINEPEPYVPEDPFVNGADLVSNGDRPFAVSAPATAVASAKPYMYMTDDMCDVKRQKMCFWCCHAVGPMVYGMPIRYDFVNKSFMMYGTFCSLQCAAAHNFSVHLGSDRAWEIHSWIQMLAKRYGYTDPVRPAPSRYLLNMFDGPLTIDEFRNAHKGTSRTYVLNIPPLVNVNAQMEVVNTSFIGSGDSSSNTADRDQRPRARAAEKKRTLDAKMGLMIQAEST